MQMMITNDFLVIRRWPSAAIGSNSSCLCLVTSDTLIVRRRLKLQPEVMSCDFFLETNKWSLEVSIIGH